jgi:hypothetical protein
MIIRRVGAESFHETRSKNLMLTESIQYLQKNDDDDDDDDDDDKNNLYHIYNASKKKFYQEY